MCRILSIPSQILNVSYNENQLNITLDSGATVSYLRLDIAEQLNLEIFPNNQLALLADQMTRMASLGEVDVVVMLGHVQMRLRALVMKHLQADCFGGTTFHADNGIVTNIREGTVLIHGRYQVSQANPSAYLPINPPPSVYVSDNVAADRDASNHVTTNESPTVSSTPQYRQRSCITKFNAISIPFCKTIYPNDVLKIPLSESIPTAAYIGITPAFPEAYSNNQWCPQVCEMINRHALFKNTSETPLIVRRYSHFRPHPVEVSNLTDILNLDAISVEQISGKESNLVNKLSFQPITKEDPDAVSRIHINKEILSSQQLSRLSQIHSKYRQVFNNDLRNGYNHNAGEFYADFTFTNKPPPTRVFSPQYNKRCTDLQQAKCDELEAQGVLVDPKLHGIPVLHVSPSWIQQKGKAKHKSLQECTLDELRFITAFNSLNDSIRPKPTMSCSANTIFKFLASWECHIFADFLVIHTFSYGAT